MLAFETLHKAKKIQKIWLTYEKRACKEQACKLWRGWLDDVEFLVSDTIMDWKFDYLSALEFGVKVGWQVFSGQEISWKKFYEVKNKKLIWKQEANIKALHNSY